MKQFTLRGLPKEIEKRIMKESKEKGISVNRAIVSLLEKQATTGKGRSNKNVYHDLDQLFGIWNKQEFEQFEKHLEAQREVDEELWKQSG
ncbi:MAG: hypothetical protein A2W01_02470 [Candidatus Solincola sediminis]|nr:MAG: hypothetical protein A2W01_02470 [Candidatus Solincola sediminis]